LTFFVELTYLNGMQSNLIPSNHAAKRWMERTGSADPREAYKSFREAIDYSVEVSLKPKYRAVALIDHKFKEAKYLKFDNWIFVVVDNIIVTVYDNKTSRFE